MSILRNSAWNMLGIGVSTVCTIPSLAIYSRLLGVELLGLLTLTFSIVGYASGFDFGLSRALIRQVSIHFDDKGTVKTFMGTTAAFVAIVSLVIATMTWAGSGRLTEYLSVSASHRADATTSFHWLSVSVPAYLLSLVGTAYFEGKEDFKTLNIVRGSSGALNAGAGVVCVYWIPTLSSVVAALCASRWILCIVVFALYRSDINREDSIRRPAIMTFELAALRSSLSFGGWLTLSNIIGPIMMYFDRFVLSHLAGAQVVAFYTVPAEVINRLLLVPGAISRALFPRLSKQHHTAHLDRRTGSILMLVCSALAILPVYIFAGPLLTIWMGPNFSGQPATVLRILLAGFFFNALAFGPFTDLQARGHSKATAAIHAAELFPYLGVLIALTYAYGIYGTAIAWALRTFFDYALMRFFSRRFEGRSS